MTGDVYVFCSDGIFEAFDEALQEFGAARVIDIVQKHWQQPAKEIVGAIVTAVQQFCGDAVQSDDRTVVVLRITN